MRIDKLDVYYVVMPLIYPWRTAYGEDRDIHSVLVKATSPQSKSVTVSTNRLFVTKRPGREVGSTEWLYFLSPCGTAYNVDTRSVNNNPQRYIGSPV